MWNWDSFWKEGGTLYEMSRKSSPMHPDQKILIPPSRKEVHGRELRGVPWLSRCLDCLDISWQITEEFTVYSSLIQNMHRALHAHDICTYTHRLSRCLDCLDISWQIMEESTDIVTDPIGWACVWGDAMQRYKKGAFLLIWWRWLPLTVERSMESALLSFTLTCPATLSYRGLK